MTGVGLILGPLIGSALYTFLGFEKTFFVYGGLEVLLAILIRINIPDRKEEEKQPTKEGEFPVEALIGETERPENGNVGGEG